MPPRAGHKQPAAKLPNVTSIRLALDYGDIHSSRYGDFIDDVRIFRKRFRTSRGLSGAELHTWNSRDHQAALTEMVDAFLERDGNGSLFWPDDPSSEKYNKYQYSKDHQYIKTLMKQLFFRTNEQHHRNTKYKVKHKPDINLEQSLSREGTEDEPISIDEAEDSSKQLLPENGSREATVPTKSNSNTQCKQQEHHPDEPMLSSEIPQDVSGSLDLRSLPALNPCDREEASSSKPQPKENSNGTLRRGRARNTRVQQQNSTMEVPGPSSTTRSLRQPRPVPNQSYRVARDYSMTTDEAEGEDSQSLRDENSETVNGETSQMVSARRDPDHNNIVVFKGVQFSDSTQEGFAGYTSERPVDSSAAQRFTPLSISSEPTQSSGQQSYAVKATHSDESKPIHGLESQHDIPLAPVAAIVADSEGPNPIKPDTQLPQTFAIQDNAKLQLHFIYNIVLSRSPVYSARGWVPSRGFEEITLHNLTEEVPLPQTYNGTGDLLVGFVLSIEGPGLDYVVKVPPRGDIIFNAFRKRVMKTIQGQLVKRGSMGETLASEAETLVYDIEIEPIRSASIGVNL